VLGAIALGAAVELVTIPLFGHLSDHVGRRPIYLLGCVAAICLSFPIFWAIATRDPIVVVSAFVIGMSVGHGIMYGVQASFLSEMFPSNLRYSGASLGYQIAAPIWRRTRSVSRRCHRRIDPRCNLAGFAPDDSDRIDDCARRAAGNRPKSRELAADLYVITTEGKLPDVSSRARDTARMTKPFPRFERDFRIWHFLTQRASGSA
jgi:hypothetical protein